MTGLAEERSTVTGIGHNGAGPLAAAREACQALIILRTLEREPSAAMHDRLLSFALDQYALDDGRDALLALLDRLESQGLILKRETAPNVLVAQLTERGFRVALGGQRAEGVERVWPDCPY